MVAQPTTEPLSSEALPDCSVYELIFEQSGAEEDTPILIDSENPSQLYTLASMRSAVLKFAGHLQQKYDWKKGDVLVVCAENSVRAIYHFNFTFAREYSILFCSHKPFRSIMPYPSMALSPLVNNRSLW